MRKARYLLGLALLVAASLYLLPALQAADEPVPDSPEVTQLLKQVKSHAFRLRNDADVMNRFNSSDVSSTGYAAELEAIREHANNIGRDLQKLGAARESASVWQQEAIDHVTPLAAELASNIQKTIEYMNNNKGRVNTPEYKAYLGSNYKVASSLSALISDYVSYGRHKAEYQKFGSELEEPVR